MTPRDQARDDLVRLRYERDAYSSRATRKRKEAIALRKQRRWLDALIADERASEYRATRDQYAAEAQKLKTMWDLR